MERRRYLDCSDIGYSRDFSDARDVLEGGWNLPEENVESDSEWEGIMDEHHEKIRKLIECLQEKWFICVTLGRYFSKPILSIIIPANGTIPHISTRAECVMRSA